MADATPRTYIYGIIAFTFIIVSGVSLIGLFGAANPKMVSDSDYIKFNQSFNKYNDLIVQVNTTQNSITKAGVNPGPYGVLDGLVSSAWNGLTLLFTSLGFMNDAINGASTVFSIPPYVPSLIILSIVIMIAFTIWSAIFQSEL